MRKTLIVIKPARIKRIPAKQRIFLIGALFLSLLLFFGAAFSFPHLTADSTHELTGSISGIRFTEGWGRHSTTYAILEIDGESCKIALNSRELSLLLRSEDVKNPTKTTRVLVTDRGEIAEMEYDGIIYHSLESENLQRSSKRILLFVFAIAFLLLGVFVFAADLLGYGVVFLRTRPKNMDSSILIEK